MSDPAARNFPPAVLWALACLLSPPGLGLLCLKDARAIGWVECLLGVLAGLWFRNVERNCRFAGVFLGILLGIGLILNIAVFHLREFLLS